MTLKSDDAKFEGKQILGSKNDMMNLVLFLLILSKVYYVWAKKKYTEVMYHNKKNDAKFEEELTCALKNDMRNLANFDPKLESPKKFFFLLRFSFTDSRGREGAIFYSTLPLPPAHKDSAIYLQLCMWDDYHLFLIVMLAFARLLLDEILPPYLITIWLIDQWCNVCLFTWWFDSRFLLQQFDKGNQWIWTPINYHPCIASKLTNQVC